MNNRRAFLVLIAAISITLVAIVILFSPNTLGLAENTLRFPKIDTIGHFTSFFILTWVAHSLLKLPLSTTVITLIFYGGLTELGQSYLGFRNGDITDFFADVTGVLCFALIKWCYLFIFTKHQKENKSLASQDASKSFDEESNS